MIPENLLNDYHKYVESLIEPKGIYPSPMMYWNREGKLHVGLIDLPPRETMEYFWRVITTEEPQAILIGLDRSAKPGQGTEFADVLTVIGWWDDPEVNWGRSLVPAVLNYQHEPRIVRPFDYENQFWNEIILREVKAFRPPTRIRTTRIGD